MNTEFLNGKNILLVDDNPCYKRYLEFVFTGDFNLVHVTSGEECVEMSDELIDIVLIDTALPDLSAAEVCEILKDDPMMGDVPVIFLTDYDSVCERLSAFNSGGDDYLSKDVSPNELHAVVEIALEFAA